MAQIYQLQAQAVDPAAIDEDAAAVTASLADSAAFAVLYRKYATDVYRYCYRRLGNREAAEDATSQIFTRALAGLRGIDDRPFRPWLFAIAHNVLVDGYRARRITASLDHVAEREDPSPSPESVAIVDEDQTAIRLLLLRLPERERRVVELRLAGLSGIEIAQALGCSHGAARVAHHRAIERLRELLTNQGVSVAQTAGKDIIDASPRR
jgi:RNA polymerase sigma-70 factor (ECF subfamily)